MEGEKGNSDLCACVCFVCQSDVGGFKNGLLLSDSAVSETSVGLLKTGEALAFCGVSLRVMVEATNT